jgi:hypothetical protein
MSGVTMWLSQNNRRRIKDEDANVQSAKQCLSEIFPMQLIGSVGTASLVEMGGLWSMQFW